MPVAVAYNPVAAVSKMGQNVFAADERARLDALTARNIGRGGGDAGGGGYIPAPLTNYPQQQGSSAPQAQIFYGKDAENNPANRGMSDYQLPGGDTQTGVDEATGQPAEMPSAPQSVKVNPGQKVQLDNLKASGATGDAFQEGMRKILGLAEPMADYTTPDGQTFRVPKAQAATLSQRDAAASAKADQVQAAADAKGAAHADVIKLQNDKLDLERQKYMTTVPAEKARLDKLLGEKDKYIQQGAEKIAGLEVTTARNAVNDYIKAKGYVPLNDPELLKRQEAVKAAMQAEKAIIEQGRGTPAASSGVVAPATAQPPAGLDPAGFGGPPGTPSATAMDPRGFNGPPATPTIAGSPPTADATSPGATGDRANWTNGDWKQYSAGLQKQWGTTTISPKLAKDYVERAGRDINKARELAKKDGWSF